jgi:EAL domain-containing protein (putative c-di-GMP-specific phosphodiesterase class I)
VPGPLDRSGARRHPPSIFIPLAETTGLIVPLGRQIVAQAASALARWHRDRPGLGLSINLSVAQLKEDDRFIDYVRATLAREGLPPAAIEFEVTESIFLDPALPVVDRRLRELVAMGIGLAIDDFGTGYSSLGYLRRFPFAAIKIDRSFVREIGSDNGRAIVEAIVGLGLNLKKRLVAEGVETSPQLELVRHLGCHEAQGYLLGRPEPADAVPALLAA